MIIGIRRSTSRDQLFFFNDTATTEIYTLSLHDALPIYLPIIIPTQDSIGEYKVQTNNQGAEWGKFSGDRKSTRLNSSHQIISYAVFCLKKKKSPNPAYNSTHH